MKNLWDNYKAHMAVAGLLIYVLLLGVATADQVFDLGLFPPKLNRMIDDSINHFDADDIKTRNQAFTEIIQYGTFAVPQLVDSLDRGGRIQQTTIKALQEITEQKFDDPAQWRKWYGEHKKDFK